MSAFKSMVYRQFKVSRQFIFLTLGMMPGFCLLLWIIVILPGMDGGETEGLAAINAMMEYSSVLIAVMLGVTTENVMKSDIESGWLTYSYAMPIKPSHRALSRIVCHAVVTLMCSAVCLVNQALICKYTGKEFSLHYVTILALCTAGATAFRVIMNLFLLSARTVEEYKKAEPKYSCAMLGIGAVIIVILKLTVASDTMAFLEKVGNFRMTDKAAAIGLIIGLAAAALFTFVIYVLDCRILGNPYGGISADSKAKADKRSAARAASKPAEKLAIRDDDDHFNGFLYKELRKNKGMIIFTASLPFIGIAISFIFNLFFALNDGNSLKWVAENASSVYVRAIIAGISTFIMTMLPENIFTDGGKKVTSYFTATLPGGIKRNLYYKYVVILLIDFIFFVSLNIADSILITINCQLTGNTPMSLSGIFASVFFLILFINAINTPVITRFGENTGTFVRLFGLIGLTVASVLVFCFMGERATDAILGFFVDLFKKLSKGEIPDGLMLTLSIAPIAVMVMYMLSYKISVKCYMKGVQSYDK